MCINNLLYLQILLIFPAPLPTSIFHIVVSLHTLSFRETELHAYEMYKFSAIEKIKGGIV